LLIVLTRRYRLFPIVVIGFFLPFLLLAAQTSSRQEPPPPEKDTTQAMSRDSVALRDSTYRQHSLVAADSVLAPTDTTRMSTPSLVGTLDRSLDSTKMLTQEDLDFLDYRYFGGLLEFFPGVFIREQFMIGGYNQLNIRGTDWRGIAILSNGRLLNDPASGVYNTFHFTTEYADRIELISGPRAFLFGLNSTGGAINVVTKNYNSNRAYTKINYAETANNYQYSDGTFSQNISRKINLTLGFQHQGWGGRFVNSANDAWNVRIKARYNISRNLNIILSEYLTRTETRLNGGISLEKSGGLFFAFDRILAVPVNSESYEKVSRHDVDLSLVGTLLGDTTNVSTLTLYYSSNLREYRDEENTTLANGVRIHTDHRSAWFGATLTQDYHTEWQRFNLGANIERRRIDESANLRRQRNTIGSLWAKEELVLSSIATLALFGRYDSYLTESNVALGTDASATVLPWLTVFGGISHSKRFPNYQELFWHDSTVRRIGSITSEKHTTLEVGGRIHLPRELELHLAYFFRRVDSPILLLSGGSNFVFPGVTFAHGDRIMTHGIEAKLKARVWLLYLEGTILFLQQTDTGDTSILRYPHVVASGGVYFWQKLLEDNLDLKIGFRGRFQSSSRGELFNPEVVAFVPNKGTSLGAGSAVDGVLFAGLGRAVVSLTWENLTNARSFITPYYPVLDRAIKLGVRWQLWD
jgi:outer membrane receptor protein involved in Fe transport